MSQPLVRDGLLPGVPGMLAGIGPHTIISRTTAPSEIIIFGYGVVIVTGEDRQCKLPSSAGDKILGVALKTHKEQIISVGGAQFDEGETVPVLQQGHIYVLPEQLVIPGDPVYLRHTVGTVGLDPGRWRKDDDTAKATQLTNAQWLIGSAAEEVAVLSINIP